MKTLRHMVAGLLGSLAFASAAQAGPLPIYPKPFNPEGNPACVNYGDFISCSLGFLNFMAGLPVTQDTGQTPQGYIIDIPQGFLEGTLVLGTGAGGNPSINTDLSPTGIDNAYDTPNAPALWSTTTEPDPGGAGQFAGDTADTWDIEVSKLVSLLTSGGAFHELAIGFDHNQAGASQSINVWAVATLVDLQNAANNNSFELNSSNVGYAAFNTTRDAFDTGGVPLADFVSSFAFICIDTSANTVTPQNTACPNSPNIVEVKNNLGTSKAEFLAFIPELSSELLGCVSPASCVYDVVSVQYRFEGANDGFEDLFALAGREISRVPEPATLGMLALALIALAFVRRRPA